MSEYTYTAEDFAQAEFAIDPSEDSPLDGRWVRTVGGTAPWGTAGGKFGSDEQMAATGCIPVYAEPYSPEALQRAWEHGEKPGQDERATEGTVSIAASGGHLSLYVNADGDGLASDERIIYRPPVPERDPVADLAQIMADVLPEEAGSSVALRRYAEALAEHGVRVVTGDE